MYVDQTLLHQQENLHNFLSTRAEDGPVAVQVCFAERLYTRVAPTAVGVAVHALSFRLFEPLF